MAAPTPASAGTAWQEKRRQQMQPCACWCSKYNYGCSTNVITAQEHTQRPLWGQRSCYLQNKKQQYMRKTLETCRTSHKTWCSPFERSNKKSADKKKKETTIEDNDIKNNSIYNQKVPFKTITTIWTKKTEQNKTLLLLFSFVFDREQHASTTLD